MPGFISLGLTKFIIPTLYYNSLSISLLKLNFSYF